MPTITITSNDRPVELHYEDVGTGRPVVLVHGWPLSGRSWEPQVPALVDAGYRVVTYDRRGFGASSQPWDGYDYDTLAADLAALIEELGLHDVTLVGFSMGGGEVARYLARYGDDAIAAAVFAAAVPPYLYKADDNPDGGLDDDTIEGFENGVRGDRIAFLDGFTTDFFTAGDRQDLVSDPFRRYARSIAEFASPRGTLDCIGAFSRTDFRDDLARVRVPTLVIHGDSDGIVPFEVSGKRTHEAVAGSSLVLIEGGPHGLNATHASQFNRALLDFLAAPTDAERSTPAAGSAPAAASAAPAIEASGAETAARHEAEHAPEETAPVEVADSATPTADASTADAPDAGSSTESAPAGASVMETEPAIEPADESSADDSPLAGLTWRTAEADTDVANDGRPTARDVREGKVADPNLGDIPVDDQPHPGSLT